MSTDKTRLESRPATAADVVAFFGKNSPQTVRARVVEVDGVVQGIAGYYIAGGIAIMFSDSKELPKVTIWRESKKMMESMKLPAICIGSGDSRSFLERLGWAYVGTTDAGEIFQWHN